MSAIQKMLLKNIDQETELILIKQKQYDLDFFYPRIPRLYRHMETQSW